MDSMMYSCSLFGNGIVVRFQRAESLGVNWSHSKTGTKDQSYLFFLFLRVNRGHIIGTNCPHIFLIFFCLEVNIIAQLNHFDCI